MPSCSTLSCFQRAEALSENKAAMMGGKGGTDLPDSPMHKCLSLSVSLLLLKGLSVGMRIGLEGGEGGKKLAILAAKRPIGMEWNGRTRLFISNCECDGGVA